MGLVEKHPTDEGKYQATFNEYGHGVGNGKSRNGVYKHHKTFLKSLDFVQSDSPSEPETSDFVQSESTSEPETSDFVQDKSEEWSSISWADDENTSNPIPRTIPKPLADVAKGKAKKVSVEATGQVVRFGFVGLDRMVTHWGRGVMSSPKWSLTRSPEDYDALEASTVALLAHYGVEIPLSPVMVWGATVGAAYGPPILYIKKNADPNRIKKKFLSKLFGKLNIFKRRRKAKINTKVTDDDGQ